MALWLLPQSSDYATPREARKIFLFQFVQRSVVFEILFGASFFYFSLFFGIKLSIQLILTIGLCHPA